MAPHKQDGDEVVCLLKQLVRDSNDLQLVTDSDNVTGCVTTCYRW